MKRFNLSWIFSLCSILSIFNGNFTNKPLIYFAKADVIEVVPWPIPYSMKKGEHSQRVYICPRTKLMTKTPSPDLSKAFQRFKWNSFPHKTGTSDKSLRYSASILSAIDDFSVEETETTYAKTVFMNVNNVDAKLQLLVDESYTLVIESDGKIFITAETQFGAYHALETLSQIIQYDFSTDKYVIANVPWHIEDKPRFPHREVLIDTSRHFQPVTTLKSFIRSLPYAKINTLHWHLIDTNSFPFCSKVHPKLCDGAYSDFEKYSVYDIKDVVEFARLHGVRVIVEMDVPGHAASWCTGYPEVCPSASCKQPLNVANNATFEFIDKLFEELSGLFFDAYAHLGGDETAYDCWESVPSISQWMKSKKMTSNDAFTYFIHRTNEIALKHGKIPIVWSEVFDRLGTKLDNRTIVQKWLKTASIKDIVSKGYRALWSQSPDGWYLDHLKDQWQHIYEIEPCEDATEEECKLVLGGGGEMWGETVDTSDLEQTVWPKLGAIAERLWSPKEKTKTAKEAEPRYRRFRCLLNQRGVKAAPSMNEVSRESPHGPGACLDQ